MAVDADRPQALLHGLRGAVHAELDAVRHGGEPSHVDPLPGDAGPGRGWTGTERTGDSGRYLRPRTTEHGLCHLRHGDRGGAGDRADIGRVDYGQLQLALD